MNMFAFLSVVVICLAALALEAVRAYFAGHAEKREARLADLETKVKDLREVSASHAKGLIELQRKGTNEALKGLRV